MKLIEDDQGDAVQGGIVEEAPGEDAFRDHLQAGVRGDPAVETDGVAHGPAHGFAALPGHPPGRRHRGDPPGLQHDNLSLAGRKFF